LESKKRWTQNILPDMFIEEQDGVTRSIMLDFKSLCSTSTFETRTSRSKQESTLSVEQSAVTWS
jgi:hypothetical protein